MPSTELAAYLDKIDAPPAVRSRAKELRDFYAGFVDLSGGTTLLSEMVAEDGSRDFQGLWIFTPDWVMEARFPDGDNEELDGTVLGSLVRWVLTATRYDFKTATAESRLRAELWFAGEVVGELHASGKNCEAVSAAISRYLTLGSTRSTSPSGSP